MYEYSIDVDIPIQEVWKFSINPVNWSKWNEPIESFHYDEPLKTGSIIKAKMRNQNSYTTMLITELNEFEKFDTSMKFFLLTQKSSCTTNEISPERTRIIFKMTLVSILLPFFRKSCYKRAEKIMQEYLCALVEGTKRTFDQVNRTSNQDEFI